MMTQSLPYTVYVFFPKKEGHEPILWQKFKSFTSKKRAMMAARILLKRNKYQRVEVVETVRSDVV